MRIQTTTFAKIITCLGVFGGALSMVLIRYSRAQAITMLFYRLLFTSLLLIIPLLINQRGKVINALKTNLLSHKALFLTALFNTLAMICWIFAVNNTSIASAVIISNMHPVLVLLVSMLFWKIKYNKKAILGALITLIGCVAMSFGDYMSGGHHFLGDVFSILAGSAFGMYLLAVKSVRSKMSIDVYMFINYTLSFIFIAVLALILRAPLLPAPGRELLIFLGLALFATILGQGLVDWGLRYVSPAFASLSFLLENIYAIILGMAIFSEYPPVSQLIWGSVLVFGVLIFNKYENA